MRRKQLGTGKLCQAAYQSKREPVVEVEVAAQQLLLGDVGEPGRAADRHVRAPRRVPDGDPQPLACLRLLDDRAGHAQDQPLGERGFDCDDDLADRSRFLDVHAPSGGQLANRWRDSLDQLGELRSLLAG